MDNHNACESAWLNGYKAGFEGAKKKPVDVAVVVRCKDCKHFECGDYCNHDKMEHSRGREDDFCSYGERKKDG